MADYGVKFAQKDFNLLTCADYQLLFSSAWPLLKIIDQGAFSIADTTLDVVIATHSLGFVPFFLVYDTAGSKSRLSSHFALAMNGTDLKWQGATRGAGAGTFTGYYRIFYFDLATVFTAPINITTSQAAITRTDHGIKFAKDGKSVFSTDLRDFVVHSGARSPLIHKSDHGSFGVGGGNSTITHNLQYEPMFFVFAKLTVWGDSRYQMVVSAEDSYVIATATTTQFFIPYQCDYSYIIFKDPILLN